MSNHKMHQTYKAQQMLNNLPSKWNSEEERFERNELEKVIELLIDAIDCLQEQLNLKEGK